MRSEEGLLDSAGVSVLMSVYAGERPDYLNESLKSIRNQSVEVSEVVLVEDGVLPRCLSRVIDEYRRDLPIKSVKLETNRGLAVALNEGLKVCQSDLVVRMDSDDISLPDRIEKQVRFMVQNPDVSVSSASLIEFDDEGREFSRRTLPLHHEELVRFAKTRSPISHAVAIFRRRDVLAVGGYPLFKRSQDVALWSLMIVKGYKLANLPDTLYKVRAGEAFMSRSGLGNFRYEYMVIKYQRDIGFLSWYDYYKNIVVRFVIAVAPIGLKKKLYSIRAFR